MVPFNRHWASPRRDAFIPSWGALYSRSAERLLNEQRLQEIDRAGCWTILRVMGQGRWAGIGGALDLLRRGWPVRAPRDSGLVRAVGAKRPGGHSDGRCNDERPRSIPESEARMVAAEGILSRGRSPLAMGELGAEAGVAEEGLDAGGGVSHTPRAEGQRPLGNAALQTLLGAGQRGWCLVLEPLTQVLDLGRRQPTGARVAAVPAGPRQAGRTRAAADRGPPRRWLRAQAQRVLRGSPASSAPAQNSPSTAALALCSGTTRGIGGGLLGSGLPTHGYPLGRPGDRPLLASTAGPGPDRLTGCTGPSRASPSTAGGTPRRDRRRWPG